MGMNPTNATIYCICGLPARSSISEGAYCSPACYRVGQTMYLKRAQETAWMARQVGKVAGLQQALDRVTPKRQVPVDYEHKQITV